MDDEILFGKLDTRDPKDLELLEKLLFDKQSDDTENFSDSEKKAV